MKNKVLRASLIVLIIFMCTACNGKITREIRHAGFSVGNKFICDSFYPQDKEDTSFDRIRYFTATHLINRDGKIFEISLDKPYQSGQNCKEATTNIRVKAIYDDKIIKVKKIINAKAY